MEISEMVLSSEKLSLESLTAIFDGDALAVRVPNYLDRDTCEQLCSQILSSARNQQHRKIYVSNVLALTDALASDTTRDTYLRESDTRLRDFRAACESFGSPVDRIRCELDEVWPGGAMLLRVNERPAYFGMVRIWEQSMEALPHFDIVSRAAPEVRHEFGFHDQLGINLYLRTPSSGGQTELWDLTPDDLNPAQHRITDTYGYDRSLLPPPTSVIQPVTGDLLMLRSTRLHAVCPTAVGERVTLSGFIGHRSLGEELRLWS